MKKIRLTQGHYAVVSVEDFEELNSRKWWFHKKKGDRTGYARGIKEGKHVFMHWEVMEKGCDHINRNGLDNRRENLRKATPSQQSMNRGTVRGKKTPGCKGVTVVRDKKGIPKYWIARITVSGERRYLGTFKSSEEASATVKKFLIKEHGEFACW